jgi:hypothetical protein
VAGNNVQAAAALVGKQAGRAARGTGLATDTLDKDDLGRMFGVAAAVMATNPDLDAVFQEILDQKITDPARMLAMLQGTGWFQRHTADWLAIEKDRQSKDPALWDAAVNKRAEAVMQQYEAAGGAITPEQAREVATKLIYGSGWNGEGFEIYDEKWLNEAISATIDFGKTKMVNGVEVADLTGRAMTLAQELYALAYDYGMDTSMSNEVFAAWFQRTLKGAMEGDITDEQLDDELVTNASSMFPGLQGSLQRGMTLRQAANPYLKAVADTLELDVNDVSLSDDLMQQVLNGTSVDGEFKPMNLYQAKLHARKDKRWQYTGKARQEYTDMASRILEDFGFGG